VNELIITAGNKEVEPEHYDSTVYTRWTERLFRYCTNYNI